MPLNKNLPGRAHYENYPQKLFIIQGLFKYS